MKKCWQSHQNWLVVAVIQTKFLVVWWKACLVAVKTLATSLKKDCKFVEYLLIERTSHNNNKFIQFKMLIWRDHKRFSHK